jgi:nitrite reductase (NADH) large subunit
VAHRHLVIVGSSAAGLAALEAIREVDAESRITVVSEEERPAYSRVMLPHLLSGEQRSAEIRTLDFFRDLSVTTAFGRKVAAIQAGELRMEGGGRVPYDRLLIATGAAPRLPPIPGIDADGVCTLRTRADAEAVARRLDRAKAALVIGAGRICVLATRAFLARGVQVEVVESESTILSGMLDPAASALARARLEAKGVRVRTGTQVARIVSGRHGAEAAITSTGEEIRAELVVVGAGNLPCAGLATSAGIAVAKGVLVDRLMQSSEEGIYAAGDVAESPELLDLGRRAVCGTWSEAVLQGRVAGLAMAGRHPAYDGCLRMNALDVLGRPAASVGLTEPADRCRVVVASHGQTYRKLVLRGDRLVGAVLFGNVDEAGVLAGLIRAGARVGGERELRRTRYGDVLRASIRATGEQP